MSRQVAIWALRLSWFLLPLSVGITFSDGISSVRPSIGWVIWLLWVAWAGILSALALPSPLSLTLTRVAAAVPLALTIWAQLLNGASDSLVTAAIHSALTLFLALNHLVGDQFVDSTSYGDERRLLLRPSFFHAVAAVPVTGAILCLIASGPFLVARQNLILGVAAVVVGLPIAVGLLRSLHMLSRRWVVLVPNGLVLHDHQALAQPTLFRRTSIERLGPAIAGTPAVDLTSGAVGLFIECELTDPVPFNRAAAQVPKLWSRIVGTSQPTASQSATLRRFLIAPSRPGCLLSEATDRRITVG